MSQYFKIHPQNPQVRLIQQAVEILRAGGIIAYPTDSSYAFGCLIGEKAAIDRIRQLRKLDAHHEFTLICRDISEISVYAKMENNQVFRMLKANTPGPYTFLLEATREVPRRLLDPRRKVIGVRIPDHVFIHALLEGLSAPLMSTTLQLPNMLYPMTDPEEIWEKLGKQVDLVIESGVCGLDPTTVVDLTGPSPEIVRQGKGELRS